MRYFTLWINTWFWIEKPSIPVRAHIIKHYSSFTSSLQQLSLFSHPDIYKKKKKERTRYTNKCYYITL